MAEQELKACPFGHRRPGELLRMEWSSDDGGFEVFCARCGTSSGAWATMTEAAASWNTRPLESALTSRLASAEAEVERLRAGIKAMSVPLNAAHQLCIEASLVSIEHDPVNERRHPLLVALESAMLGYIEAQEADEAAAARRQQGGTDAR